jgi:DNA-binding NtrC family response regulator
VESELFGHRRGAFSGAVEDRLGRFQMADGGTLFLDELGELPGSAQAKLLRVLESRRVQRLGDAGEEPVDVRVVAATKIDLGAAVAAGTFREDLYFRLKVFTIVLPPLRDRREDLPDLVESLVPLLARLHGREVQGVSAQAMELLRHHSWPGNVRELRNVLEQALVRTAGEWITAGALGLEGPVTAPGAASAEAKPAYPDELEAARALFERQHIARCLELERGDVARTATRLGIARSNLYKRLKEYSLEASDFRT